MAAAVRSGPPSLAAGGELPPSRPRYGGTARRGRQNLRVDIVDERGRHLCVPGLAGWLRRVAPGRARGAVTIVFVGDTRMRALNRTYRRKDYATDVLSFGGDTDAVASGGRGRIGGTPSKRDPLPVQPIQPIPPVQPTLGDIVIARGVARRQAREAEHSELDELRVLALHGLLHLLGYDHERDNGRMRRVEQRLRRKGGLSEGLIERAAE